MMADEIADSDQPESSETTTVEVFEPKTGGYKQSALEEKLIGEPEPMDILKSESGIPEPDPESDSMPEPGPSGFPQLKPRKEAQPHPPVEVAVPKPAKPVSVAKPRPPVAKPVPAAKSKSEKKKKEAMEVSAESHGKALADSVVNGFVGALKGMANVRGGHLLMQDIETLSDSFHKQADKLASSISKSMSMYAESQARMEWDPERINAFERILVKQFSHLLGSDEEAMKDHGVISRRCLSGFFSAIKMMSGPERIGEMEQDAYLIMQRVRYDMKGKFEWDTVYEDLRVKNIIRDLVVELTPHFEHLDRRISWLLSVINGHLAPAVPGAPGAEWQLSEYGLLLLLEALFAEIKEMLDDDLGRLRITKQYGVDTLDAILRVMENIEHHHEVLDAM